jgi:hypothetical protein
MVLTFAISALFRGESNQEDYPRENAKEHKRKKLNMDTTEIMSLCDLVRETAYAIHDYHGNGYLEKVYENALVNEVLLIELKACRVLTTEHQSQLLHYLKATGVEHGLLINFGSYKFEIKKFVKTEERLFTARDHKEC